MIADSDLPYTTATQLIYRSVYPRDTLERALAMLDYQEARRQQAEARAAGRIVGIGIATYVEPNTYGSEFYKTAGIPGSGHDAAIVRIEPSGAVSAQIGVVSQGQGHLTTVAQALADALTVPIEKVRVQSGDTAAAPYGMGTRGARGGVVSAGAALGAVRIVKDKLLRIAAHLLRSTAAARAVAISGSRSGASPASTPSTNAAAERRNDPSYDASSSANDVCRPSSSYSTSGGRSTCRLPHSRVTQMKPRVPWISKNSSAP